MSSSQASMAALRMVKFNKSSLQSLIPGLIRPTSTAPTVQLLDRAFESTQPSKVSPTRLPIHQQLRPYENNMLRPIDSGIYAINPPPVEVRGGRIIIEDENNDEEAYGSDDEDEGFSEIEDFDDDDDDDDDKDDEDDPRCGRN